MQFYLNRNQFLIITINSSKPNTYIVVSFSKLQFAASKMVPVTFRTFIGTLIAKRFNSEYFSQQAPPQNRF